MLMLLIVVLCLKLYVLKVTKDDVINQWILQAMYISSIYIIVWLKYIYTY